MFRHIVQGYTKFVPLSKIRLCELEQFLSITKTVNIATPIVLLKIVDKTILISIDNDTLFRNFAYLCFKMKTTFDNL